MALRANHDISLAFPKMVYTIIPINAKYVKFPRLTRSFLLKFSISHGPFSKRDAWFPPDFLEKQRGTPPFLLFFL